MVIKNLLEIDDLNIRFMSDQETVNAVRDVSITLRSGEVLGIVGESGAGKSTVGNAIVNLLDAPGEIVKGKVIFEGQNLVGMDDKAMRTIRGKKIGMIFQDNAMKRQQGVPTMTTQMLNQIATASLQAQKLGKLALGESTENMRLNAEVTDTDAFREAMELLDSVAEQRRESDDKAVH